MKARLPLQVQTSTSVVCVTRRYQVDSAKIKTMAQVICGRLGVTQHELAIRLVGSTTIRRLNRTFRQIDRSTDVLSFPQLNWTKPAPLITRASSVDNERSTGPSDVLGDLVISLPDAATNAKRIGQPLSRELGFLLVHGILHLCGYDHITPGDERQMRRAQRVLMRALSGAKGGKPLWTGSVKLRQQRQTHVH